MTDIGDLTAKLTLDTVGFSTGISQVQSLAGGLASGVGNAFSGLATAVGAAITGATAAVGALVTESVKGFAEFEQLAGGAQKIFDQIDYNKIQADANNAWQTMNLSASQYLSLINNVGASFAATMGDQKGYDVAKQGMQAIADYASGTGRNVEELNQKFAMITRSTSSYQSIADQFSGILPATSKAFLEQAQAAGLLDTKYKELTKVPIAEYQEAVAAMLEKGVAALNLTGNTAEETRNTVSGSFNGMKSAWDNLVVSLSQGGDAFSGALSTFIESVGNFADQIIPVISQALQGVSELIAGIAPVIAAEIPGLVATVGPMLLDAAVSIVATLSAALPSLISSITTSISAIIPSMATTVVSLIDSLVGVVIPQIVSFGGNLIAALAESLVNNAAQLSSSFLSALGSIMDTLAQILPQIISAGVQIISALANSFSQNSTMIVGSVIQIVTVILTTLVQNIPTLIAAGMQIIQGLVSGIVSNMSMITSAVVQIITAFVSAILENLPMIFAAAVQIGLEIIAGVVFAIPALIVSIGKMLGIVSDGSSQVQRQTSSMVESVEGANTSIKGGFDDIISNLQTSQISLATTSKTITETSSHAATSAQENAKRVVSSAEMADRLATSANHNIILGFKTTLGEAEDFVANLNKTLAKTSNRLEKLAPAVIMPTVDPSGVISGCDAIIKAVEAAMLALDRLSKKNVSFGSGGSGSGRAAGGWVSAGTTYLVGELGPELITPSRSGYVHTAEETEDILGGRGGGDVVINISGDIYDDERSMRQKMKSAILGVLQEQVAYG